MTRSRLCTIMVVILCVGMVAPSVANAATYDAWMPANDGLWGAWVTALTKADTGALFAGTLDEGVFTYTAVSGWQNASTGLPIITSGMRETYPAINVLGTWPALHIVVAGTNNGTYAWNGDRWSRLGSGLDGLSVWSLSASLSSDGRLLAGTNDGVWTLMPSSSSWVARNAIMRGDQITSFLSAVNAPATLWCSGRGGLFRSDDSGSNWLLVSSSVVSAASLAYYPHRAGTMFAAGPAGIQRSFDGGTTWSSTTAKLGNPAMLAVVPDDFDPNLIRAAGSGGVIESMDAGETWHWTWSSSAGTAVTACILDSAKPAAPVVIGTSVAVGSVNGGRLVLLPLGGLGLLETGATTVHPVQKTMYVVRRSGLYRAVWGGSWQLVNSTLGNAGVLALTVDAEQPRTLYAATRLGVRRSGDDGVTWSDVHPAPPGDVMDIACGSGELGTLYAATTSGLFRLDHVGAGEWRDVGPASTAFVAVAAAPRDPGTVFAVTGMSVYRSTDNCATWQRWLMLDASWDLHVLAVDPQDSWRLYAATSDGLWMSQRGGVWTRWGTSPRVSIQGLAIAASGPQTVAVVTTKTGVLLRQEADDSIAPTVTVLSPSDGSTVASGTVDISVHVTDAQSGLAQVTINGTVMTHVGPDDLFQGTAALVKGTNVVVVEAFDVAGNRSTRLITVTYKPPTIVLTLHIGSNSMKVSDGRVVLLDAQATILRGRTFLPIRAVVEALGGTVAWDAASRTADLRLGQRRAELQLGSAVALVDGRYVQIDPADAGVVPIVVAGRTLLPVRFVAESLGCVVGWDAATKTVTVTYGS